MNFAKTYAFIVLGFVLLLSRTDGDKLCSCYSFNNKSNGMAWPQAMGNCNYNNKTLVVMETEREWEFVKNEIQNRVGSNYGEWFIGLEKNFTTGNWTWVNGKPLTINKWQGSNPEPSDFYGLIHKEYPAGYKGSFSTISGNIQRGWICEEETDNCQGDCFFHTVPTSTSPPRTKAVTARGKRSTEQDITSPPGTKVVSTHWRMSTEQDITDISVLLTDQGSSTTTLSVVTNIGGLQNDKNCFTHYLTIAILAGLLFILSIILGGVLILLRKRQNVIKETVIKNQHGFRESLPLNALNVGAQLSLAAGSKRNQSEPSVQQEGVYTALCSESVMTSDEDGSRTYASLVKSTDEESDIEYENQISVLEYINA